MNYLFPLSYTARGSGSLHVSVTTDMVYEEAEAWTKSGLGEPPTAQESPPCSNGAKSSLGSRLRCLGPSAGNEPPAVGIAPGKEPQALLGSALALPNDGEAPDSQRWGSLLLKLSDFEGAGDRGGEQGLPPGSSLCSPLLDCN